MEVRTRNLFQGIYYMILLVNWPEIKRYWQIQRIRIFRSGYKTAEHFAVCSPTQTLQNMCKISSVVTYSFTIKLLTEDINKTLLIRNSSRK